MYKNHAINKMTFSYPGVILKAITALTIHPPGPADALLCFNPNNIYHITRYHNKRMINYDQGDGVQVEVSGVSNKSMKSVLTMTTISMTQVSPCLSATCCCISFVISMSVFQAGTYTCSPSMARPDSVNVTVKHHEQALPEPVVNSEADIPVIFPELLLFTIITLAIKVF